MGAGRKSKDNGIVLWSICTLIIPVDAEIWNSHIPRLKRDVRMVRTGSTVREDIMKGIAEAC
jgi:hypothetical protein